MAWVLEKMEERKSRKEREQDDRRDRRGRSDRSDSRERRFSSSSNRDRERERKRSRSRSREERSEKRSKRKKEKRSTSRSASRHSRDQEHADSNKVPTSEISSSRHVWGNVGLEEEYELKKRKENGEDIPEEEKVKPNFGLTGALAKDEVTGNIYNGVLLKWSEPLDAAPPPRGWRIYVFKDDKIIETLYLHRQSAYLFGRETRVADHVLGHPSCSSQHAVIQFRAISDNENGFSKRRIVKPYLMDLASTNKTFLNSSPIDDSRYYEIKPKDIIKFGNSTREYVVIYEKEDAGEKGKK